VLDTAFHERVREGYLRLAAAEPRRWVVIKADRDEKAIASDVRRELDTLLGAPA
jgi:dTMP kinase